MKLSRIILLFSLILAIGLATGIGIYISKINADKSRQGITLEAKDVETSAKNTALAENKVSEDTKNSIGPATKIVKKQIYTKGEQFEKVSNETPSEDVLGMTKESFEEHVKKKGYTVDEFTSSKVVIVEKINEWPKGLYVLKSVEEDVTLFKVDEKGNLQKVSDTGVILDQVSEHDKEELIKGKVYSTLEEAEHTLGDYDS